ncbi:helix-turn-helix domain-containing protein [Sphingomonas azotifigens]|uniref:helix-turn-helix domain-containing protein n=1 Tax=Sphingomonas azotifigens TaxID=330920 RepID=UPI0009FF4D32|nr:AraC family transcriptional regulator [Sphingomonas azotifigens]
MPCDGVAVEPLRLVRNRAAPPDREILVRRFVERLLAELDRQAPLSTWRLSAAIERSIAADLFHLYAALPEADGASAAGLGQVELDRITDYIDSNLHRGIELAELAALINVSRCHFSRLFKRSTGTTPLAYVESRRIRHARTLLLETDAPLAEIAVMSGFADQSHFTRRFRQRLGITPAAFAREKGRRRSAQRAP